jgi:CO/xanthine dehydrogenase FAD-binding subunit
MNLGLSMPDYARPQTLNEALRLMAEGGWRVLAGGTDLYPGAGARLPGKLLDLAQLPGRLDLPADDGLRIGAMTTWSTIAEADLGPAVTALQQAARVVGGRQVQNAASIGGNLCNASPAADGVPPLLVLDAEVELASVAGHRRLALTEFLLGPRQTALRPGEIVVAVHIPNTALRGRSAFVKLGARSHLVISIAMVAARVVVEDGHVTSAAVAVGSCSPVAVRLPAVEAALVGAPVEDTAERIKAQDVQLSLSPIDDVRATAVYRREAAVELVRRAVAEAIG